MTRADLIERLSKRARLSKKTAGLVVETIFEALAEGLRRGEHTELRGFGTFNVRQYQAFRGRNPRNGEPVEIPSRRLATFRASAAMTGRLNHVKRPSVKLVHNGPGQPRKSNSITGVWRAFESEETPKAEEITRRMG